MGRRHRKWNWQRIAGIILGATLLLSIVYIVIRIITAPEVSSDPIYHENVRSDYTLMLLQCLLGLAVMLLPSFIEKTWRIDIPSYMHILFYIFLYCAIYLGEVHRFYYLVPYWDKILHAFSGAMLGAMGFAIVSTLNEAEKIDIRLSPGFVSLFAFCFALSVGALWEVYEYTFDGLLGLNMQKFRLENGTQLIGRKALGDTMEDIIVDALSALAIAVLGYILRRRDNKSDVTAG